MKIPISQSGEFWWLLKQVKPFLRLHLGSYVCIVLASALVLIDPLIVRFLIDEVIPNRRITWLPLIGLAFFATYMGRLGFDSLSSMLNFRAVQKMTFRSRLTLLRHLQRLSAEYHDNRPLGDTLHHLQVDVDHIGTLSGECPAIVDHLYIGIDHDDGHQFPINPNRIAVDTGIYSRATPVSRSFTKSFRLRAGAIRKDDRFSGRAPFCNRASATAFLRTKGSSALRASFEPCCEGTNKAPRD